MDLGPGVCGVNAGTPAPHPAGQRERSSSTLPDLVRRDAGSVDLDRTVPDTITEWAAGAFCVSPAGFGVAPNVALTAFQPFFVSLTLPYSVIRGEVVTLRASVFNYLPDCIMVGSRSPLRRPRRRRCEPPSLSAHRCGSRWPSRSSLPPGAARAAATRCACAARKAPPSPGS